ncbi:sensor histidine kinase [Actinoplanes utahensis]|uniref:sensor histidine kinase n=1 Tax=Actinoplanes utahensis TaxID=1869 RepID=UPI00068C5610|nr:sensor histidine kinase [Actinoplanes utahensis]
MPRGRDALSALLLCALMLAWLHWAGPYMPRATPLGPPAYALAAANALVLSWRRAAPRAVLAAVTVVTLAYMLIGYPFGPINLPFAVAAYTVGRHVAWRPAVLAAGLAVPVLALHDLGDGADPGDLLAIFPASGWVVVPFAIGSMLALRLESRARERHEAVERAAQEERLRMAQEVHDIVGHGLAAIKMQADIALHVLAKQPEVARPSLEAISGTSAHALDELRTTLGMLRSAAASQASTPGIADLDALYQRMRSAGLRIRVRTDGTPAAVPPESALAAYRTVQESLTNVLKHAYPKEADIVLATEPGALRIRATSTFVEVTPSAGGTGLAGMRERVAALGGRVTAGPAPGARFIVDAWLPVAGTVPA